jgi:hypothetical protein
VLGHSSVWVSDRWGGFQERDDISVEPRVTVQNHVSVRISFGKGFTQLLDDPLRGRVSGHAEVQDLATSVRDDEEAVEQFECHRWEGEKVERNDHLAVILEKRQPALRRIITVAADLSQISRHSSLACRREDGTANARKAGRKSPRVAAIVSA